jgi:hypothetical protein
MREERLAYRYAEVNLKLAELHLAGARKRKYARAREKRLADRIRELELKLLDLRYFEAMERKQTTEFLRDRKDRSYIV